MGTVKQSREEQFRRILSGEARGAGALLLRGALRLAEPVYAGVMRIRNARYNRGWGVRRLDRPVISVGNITTGGTGKTPVVHWLCERLRAVGHRPAVLMRGYKALVGERGDEERLLDGLLNRNGEAPVPIGAGADRLARGEEVLRERPQISVFVLDDGFQHRRLARDFELVLIDAANPFGFGHVLPRGLLREPLRGLERADALLITRAGTVNDAELEKVTATIRKYSPRAPIFRCDHVHGAVITAEGARELQDLRDTPVFLFTGIGNPEAFARQAGGSLRVVGQRFLGDHHAYGRPDLEALQAEAAQSEAAALLTTEKDYVKLAALRREGDLPVWRTKLLLRFHGEDEKSLLETIMGVLS